MHFTFPQDVANLKSIKGQSWIFWGDGGGHSLRTLYELDLLKNSARKF